MTDTLPAVVSSPVAPATSHRPVAFDSRAPHTHTMFCPVNGTVRVVPSVPSATRANAAISVLPVSTPSVAPYPPPNTCGVTSV